MRVFGSAEEFKAAVGERLGESDWLAIEQDRIDAFADATQDHQWIHVDPERAKDGPFGTTIAHGYLTLSLVPSLVQQIYRIDNARMAINYGLNKVRFTNPVKVGSRIRAASEVAEVTDAGEAVQVMLRTTIEIEGADRPAAVVEHIARYYF